MRAYKCLNKWIDLDHILSIEDVVKDLAYDLVGFRIVFMYRNDPMYIGQDIDNDITEDKVVAAYHDLVNAWLN